jgi:hypothetical protein
MALGLPVGRWEHRLGGSNGFAQIGHLNEDPCKSLLSGSSALCLAASSAAVSLRQESDPAVLVVAPTNKPAQVSGLEAIQFSNN